MAAKLLFQALKKRHPQLISEVHTISKEIQSMQRCIKMRAIVLALVLLLSLCSCESLKWTWGGFTPSAKQTIDSSSTVEELLDNASTIAMYSQAYDISDDYSPQGQYYYEKLKNLVINEVNATSEKVWVVEAEIKKYETIEFPDGYDSYAPLKKELIQKVIADDDWIKACAELLRKSIEICNSLSDLAVLTTYSRKYLSDASFENRLDVLITDSIEKTSSIYSLGKLVTDSEKNFGKDISKMTAFNAKYEELANARIVNCNSLNQLFSLRTEVLRDASRDISELSSFNERFVTLTSEKISTCNSVIDLFVIKNSIMDELGKDISELPIFNAVKTSLLEKEILSCRNLDELVAYKKEIERITGISVAEKEFYKTYHTKLVDEYLKSVSSLSLIEKYLSEGLDTSANYLGALRRIVMTEVEGGAIEGVVIDYTVICSIDDARTILSDFTSLKDCINAINSADSSKEVYDIESYYNTNKKTALFDSVITNARIIRIDFLIKRDKENSAYNEVKEQLDYYDSHYAPSMQEELCSLAETYLRSYSKDNPNYNSAHYSGIKVRYNVLSSIIEWKHSENYNNVFKNVSNSLLNLPIYIGHRGVEYENTGINLKEFIQSYDFSDWVIILTDNSNSTKKLIMDMVYGRARDYSFTFEAKKDKLVLVAVSDYKEYLYNKQDYSTLKKYFDEITRELYSTAVLWEYIFDSI